MSEKEKKCTCGCDEHTHHHDHCDDDCCEDGCDCGCGDFGEDIVELTADDGRKLKFYFVGTIEYNGKNYSAFEPAEQIEGMTEDDLVIFELAGDDEETAELLPVEDEKILDAVFQEFCKALDEEDALAEEEKIDN